VTPFGDVVAIAQRGLFVGNRGIIHDPATKTLLGRRWTTKAWLVCVLDYKGRHREVMGGRSWTELFFLDEAVALAAGHHPCFFCRRAAAEAFRTAWGKAKGGKAPLARISQRGGCTGALDLRKSCWMNGLSQRQGEARCGQSVARICLDLHRLKGTRWWPLSMVAG